MRVAVESSRELTDPPSAFAATITMTAIAATNMAYSAMVAPRVPCSARFNSLIGLDMDAVPMIQGIGKTRQGPRPDHGGLILQATVIKDQLTG